MLKDLKKIFFCNIDILLVQGTAVSLIFVELIFMYIVCSENHSIRVCEHLWPINLSMCPNIRLLHALNKHLFLLINSTTNFKKTGIQQIVIKPQNLNTASLHLPQEFANLKFKIIFSKSP